MAKCLICEKRSVSGNAVSHSQIHTKRKFKPNLQKVHGVVLCTKCIKTLKTAHRNIEELAATKEIETIEPAPTTSPKASVGVPTDSVGKEK